MWSFYLSRPAMYRIETPEGNAERLRLVFPRDRAIDPVAWIGGDPQVAAAAKEVAGGVPALASARPPLTGALRSLPAPGRADVPRPPVQDGQEIARLDGPEVYGDEVYGDEAYGVEGAPLLRPGPGDVPSPVWPEIRQLTGDVAALFPGAGPLRLPVPGDVPPRVWPEIQQLTGGAAVLFPGAGPLRLPVPGDLDSPEPDAALVLSTTLSARSLSVLDEDTTVEPEPGTPPLATVEPSGVVEPAAVREPAVVEVAAVVEPPPVEIPAATVEPAAVAAPVVVEPAAVVEPTPVVIPAALVEPAAVAAPAVVEPAAVEEPSPVVIPAVSVEPAAVPAPAVVAVAAVEEPSLVVVPAAPVEPAAVAAPAVVEPAAVVEPLPVVVPAASVPAGGVERPALPVVGSRATAQFLPLRRQGRSTSTSAPRVGGQLSGQLGGTQEEYTGDPISMEFQGSDLRAVLRVFASDEQAFAIILRANGLDFEVDGTVVRIASVTTGPTAPGSGTRSPRPARSGR